MTALRVTSPKCAAIWLADRPCPHNVFKSSTRSSVQLIITSCVKRFYFRRLEKPFRKLAFQTPIRRHWLRGKCDAIRDIVFLNLKHTIGGNPDARGNPYTKMFSKLLNRGFV